MGRLAHSLGSEEELDAGSGWQAVHGAKATAYGASCGSVTRATTRGGARLQLGEGDPAGYILKACGEQGIVASERRPSGACSLG